jgi:hypothetical protein
MYYKRKANQVRQAGHVIPVINPHPPLRFYDGWVVYALISFPFYVLPYFSAKNLPLLYQANFASQIDGASLFLGGVRAQPLLIQRVVPQP